MDRAFVQIPYSFLALGAEELRIIDSWLYRERCGFDSRLRHQYFSLTS